MIDVRDVARVDDDLLRLRAFLRAAMLDLQLTVLDGGADAGGEEFPIGLRRRRQPFRMEGHRVPELVEDLAEILRHAGERFAQDVLEVIEHRGAFEQGHELLGEAEHGGLARRNGEEREMRDRLGVADAAAALGAAIDRQIPLIAHAADRTFQSGDRLFQVRGHLNPIGVFAPLVVPQASEVAVDFHKTRLFLLKLAGVRSGGSGRSWLLLGHGTSHRSRRLAAGGTLERQGRQDLQDFWITGFFSGDARPSGAYFGGANTRTPSARSADLNWLNATTSGKDSRIARFCDAK